MLSITLRTLNYGNYGILPAMGNAGFIYLFICISRKGLEFVVKGLIGIRVKGSGLKVQGFGVEGEGL